MVFILTWLGGGFSFFFVPAWCAPFPPLVSVLCLVFLISRRTQHIVIYSLGHQGNETQGKTKRKTISCFPVLLSALEMCDFLYCVVLSTQLANDTWHHVSFLNTTDWATVLVLNWLETSRPLHVCRRHTENPNERWRIDELNLFISYLPSLWLLVMWTKSSLLLAACQTAVLQPGLSAVEGGKS